MTTEITTSQYTITNYEDNSPNMHTHKNIFAIP